MYEPYRQIIKRCFPSSTHIVDEFHYTRYITDALTKVRIKTMKMYSEDSSEYKILKRYWKLISIRKSRIKDNCFLYNPIKNKKTSLFVILDDILNLSSDLSKAYSITQDFYNGMDKIQYQEAEKWLDDFIIKMQKSEIEEFISVAHTFINYREGDYNLNFYVHRYTKLLIS